MSTKRVARCYGNSSFVHLSCYLPISPVVCVSSLHHVSFLFLDSFIWEQNLILSSGIYLTLSPVICLPALHDVLFLFLINFIREPCHTSAHGPFLKLLPYSTLCQQSIHYTMIRTSYRWQHGKILQDWSTARCMALRRTSVPFPLCVHNDSLPQIEQG